MVRIWAAFTFGGVSWFTGATPEDGAAILQGLLVAGLMLATAHLLSRAETAEVSEEA